VGYRWFYLDAVSDDRASSIVVIALLGNPFSPRFARARAQGSARALDHCAMNVAVDAPGLRRWALTERTRDAVRRDSSHVAIGASSMRRLDSGVVVVDLDERSAPWGTPIRGRIRLEPVVTHDCVVTLDGAGEHDWCPRHPLARVHVSLENPRLEFSGTGYLDENSGVRPLETAFDRWSWSRVATEHEVGITYDVELRCGQKRSHGIRIGKDAVVPFDAPRARDLGRTRFALPRRLHSEGGDATLIRTLEDGPFYARSVVETTLGGRSAYGMHETVCLERFSSRWVQFLLPFRMRVEAA
jgi:carotenoid 1,2-hydratase